MNASSPDAGDNSRALDSIGIEDVTAFIRRRGWKRIDYPSADLLVFQNGSDDNGAPIKLVLPSSNRYVDARRRIRTAVNLLAAIGNDSPDTVARDILTRGKDVFRQRLMGDANLVSLPLTLAADALSAMRDLIFQAARAQERPLPFLDARNGNAKEYVNICRFGHTFPGSFGLAVEMPIPPNPGARLFPEEEAPPFERCIMQRLMRGLKSTADAVREGDVTILTKAYHDGFNANLCEVMARLMLALSNVEVEFSMRWSPEYQVPKDLADARSILVNPERFHPFFESAAKSLRPAGVLPEEQVRGAVIALRAPDAGQAPGGGDVTLRPAGGDQRTNYHVILTGTDYRAACDAHRDGIDIVVTGRPERVGRNWRLAGARDFRAASASPKQLEGDAKD